MTEPTKNEYIYDWNRASSPAIAPGTRVLLNDETLRDGLQNPSVYAPTIEENIDTLHIKMPPNCACRTVKADIRPIVEISQRVGIALEAATFLGSSPIRRLVEDWTVDHLERTTEKAGKFAGAHGLPSMYVTEDTIRTDRDTVKRLYSTAIRNGARAVVFCDTVGHATPNGSFNLVKFVIDEVVKPSGKKIRVDWHGHNDRGLSIAHSL